MNKRVALYLRVSTIHQDYERQKEELFSYCKNNKYDIKFIFEEKVSGAIDERTEFMKMCLLDKSDIDAVIAWELSRYGRKMSTVIKTVEDFANRNICVIALKERFQSLDDDGNMTPATLMMLSFGSAMAEIERTSIRERMTSGRKHKVLSGDSYTATKPFGYNLVDKKLVINEKEAEIVRDMFKLYQSGSTLEIIAHLYNKSNGSIYSILRNEIYTGRKYSKIIDGYVETPAIIDKALFDEVQQKMNQNKRIVRKSINESPLRRKMFCCECGGLLVRHGTERNKHWQCGCNIALIKDEYATRATEMALESIKTYMAYDDTKKEKEAHIKQLYKQAADMSEVVDNMYEHIEEEKKKLEVLKDVFTADQLKREIKGIKELERECEKQEKILQNLFIQIDREKQSMEDKEPDINVIERIEVKKMSRFEKVLTFKNVYKETKILVNSKNNKDIKFVIFK